MAQPDRKRVPPRFAERLTAPVWAWPVALAAAVLAAAEIRLGAPGTWAWLPYAVLPPMAAGCLLWLGRIRVTVTADELRVDDARLPLRVVDSVTVLDADDKRDLLGPYAQPHAFVIQRPWVPGAVQVHLADPRDPTPYWVVSSRRPEVLAAVISAAAPGRPLPPAPPSPSG